MCQCPLGLISHFYVLVHEMFLISLVGVNALSGLYLISTKKKASQKDEDLDGVNALSGLYLISTGRFVENFAIAAIVSMPSRAYISFLRYPFKNLGFMRFPEPVFAGIYQNILTTAVFRAC